MEINIRWIRFFKLLDYVSIKKIYIVSSCIAQIFSFLIIYLWRERIEEGMKKFYWLLESIL